ncbi:hypothetical protein K3495_g9704 [Podosphaera aphanis]|nr:hypothetical protein K3495_g9704 [Podosphaera aphanis]
MDQNLQANSKKKPGLITVPDDEVEDCLFLDIMVPKSVWIRTQVHPDRGFSPVIVWIHSGGFTSGDKTLHRDPDYILSQSLRVNKNGAIFVFVNYRLGVFGFLSGDNHLVSNAGLLDQRAALGWIQKNIQKFGGDRLRVTVVGEDAGAASIMLHITASSNTSTSIFSKSPEFIGNKDRTPFRSAILKSPTFQPLVPSQSRLTLGKVLEMAHSISGQEIGGVNGLRKLPFKTLYAINAAVIHDSPFGTFTFGPTIDYGKKSYVPDSPLHLLETNFNHSDVNVFVGHTKNENLKYASKIGASDTGFKSAFAKIFPTISEPSLAYITEQLYPSDSDTHGEGNRVSEALSDLFVDCNTHYLAEKTKNAFSFEIDDVSPSEDDSLDRILFSKNASLGSKNGETIESFQKKLLLFAMFSLQGAQSAGLRQYNSSGEVMLVSNETVQGYHNVTAARKKQCNYWANLRFELFS